MRASRWIKCVSLASTVVCLSYALSYSVVDARPAHERASAWVEGRAGALPNTLGELAAFPLEYRKAIFTGLSSSDKARLWREQLAALLEERDLSVDQRSAIEQFRSLLTADTYGGQPSAELARLCDKNSEASRHLASHRSWFTELASHTQPRGSAAALLVHLKEGLNQTVMAKDVELPGCTCANGSWCSCWTCTSLNCWKPSQANCGCGWAFACDGLCE